MAGGCCTASAFPDTVSAAARRAPLTYQVAVIVSNNLCQLVSAEVQVVGAPHWGHHPYILGPGAVQVGQVQPRSHSQRCACDNCCGSSNQSAKVFDAHVICNSQPCPSVAKLKSLETVLV